MAVVITIAGVTVSIREGSLRIQDTVNGRATASFDIVSLDASYRPALDAEVIITEDGTRIFGGMIDRPMEAGVIPGKCPEIITQVSAFDFNQYAERRWILAGGGFPAGYNIGQMAASLAGYLAPYGVTLDAGQVTGPTFAFEQIYEYRQLRDVLDSVVGLTAKYGDPFVWRIDHYKVFSIYQPSTEAAPFDVSTANGMAIGDIEVETTREKYANRIIVKAMPQAQELRVESFTGDGTTDTFTLQYTPTKMYGYVSNGSVNETLTTTDFVGSATWTYDATANTIKRETGAPGSGVTVSVMFDGTFSAEASAQDASYLTSPWEQFLTVDQVPSDTTVQAIADAYLAEYLPIPKTIRYTTLGAGLAPGQVQTVTVAERNLSVSVLITEITTTDFENCALIRHVTAVSGAIAQSSWRDVYKLWAGDKTGSSPQPAVSMGTGTAVSGGAAPPNRAVQYNKNGSFGGDAAFIWYDDENSIVCGELSSITAADFESCQVFGSDNHITDP